MAVMRGRRVQLSAVRESPTEQEADDGELKSDELYVREGAPAVEPAAATAAKAHTLRAPPPALARLPLGRQAFASTPEASLETARTLDAARAARLLPPQEKQARARSLEALRALTPAERVKMYQVKYSRA